MIALREYASLIGNSGNDEPFTGIRATVSLDPANNGGMMELSRLRASNGMRYALLNPILEELAREGRRRIAGEIIMLFK